MLISSEDIVLKYEMFLYSNFSLAYWMIFNLKSGRDWVKEVMRERDLERPLRTIQRMWRLDGGEE